MSAPAPALDLRPSPRGDRGRFDLLAVPVVGAFLRWPRSRALLQGGLLVLATLMVIHALLGPELAAKNLGPLLTWVHFRGAVVLVLLVCGNFFCTACPFVLPRNLARRWVNPRWMWPTSLRNKWLAAFLFVGVLFAYELFDLWSASAWTGVLIASYFASALLADLLFKGAAFCKYVCPIGQFNFIGATLSPLEVTARDPGVCGRCETRDCIRGRGSAEGRIERRGCELRLFVPNKVDNLDCTFCLDCVHACPHDNVGIRARVPGDHLSTDGSRPGVGELDRRADFSALVVVFVFGALLNAFAMVSPVYVLEEWIAARTGLSVEWPILGGIFAIALVVEPLVLLGGAALLSRRAGLDMRVMTIVNRFVWCLVPLGFAVWLAHYGFHFLTGVWTVIPVAQSAAIDAFGWAVLGSPRWFLSGIPAPYVLPIEFGFLGLGVLGSLLVAWRTARALAPDRAAAVCAPWAGVGLLLFATASWILTQPMEMRGTLIGV